MQSSATTATEDFRFAIKYYRSHLDPLPKIEQFYSLPDCRIYVRYDDGYELLVNGTECLRVEGWKPMTKKEYLAAKEASDPYLIRIAKLLDEYMARANSMASEWSTYMIGVYYYSLILCNI